MALQLAREQGITLRGSAEIVAEFFCESSRRTRWGDLGFVGRMASSLGLGDREALPALVPDLWRKVEMRCGPLLID
jgi:hypothetical protein